MKHFITRTYLLLSNKGVFPCLSPGYGLCFLFMAATPVLRSKLSKLVDSSEQGK